MWEPCFHQGLQYKSVWGVFRSLFIVKRSKNVPKIRKSFLVTVVVTKKVLLNTAVFSLDNRKSSFKTEIRSKKQNCNPLKQNLYCSCDKTSCSLLQKRVTWCYCHVSCQLFYTGFVVLTASGRTTNPEEMWKETLKNIGLIEHLFTQAETVTWRNGSM